MKITPKWDFCEGSLDTENAKMVCVPNDKDGYISLGLQENGQGWIYSFAKIKLYSGDKYVDFKEVFDDAVILGKEIARRWNQCETKK